MGEHLFTGGDLRLLGSAVLEGAQVVVGGVHLLAGGNAQLAAVGIRPDSGQDQRGQCDDQHHDQGNGSHLVFQQALAAVLEEGGGGTHLHHVRLILGTGRHKGVQIHMQTERFFQHISSPLPYSSVMRGSTALYRMSLTRFITTISVASTMVVPMISG